MAAAPVLVRDGHLERSKDVIFEAVDDETNHLRFFAILNEESEPVAAAFADFADQVPLERHGHVGRLCDERLRPRVVDFLHCHVNQELASCFTGATVRIDNCVDIGIVRVVVHRRVVLHPIVVTVLIRTSLL